MTSTPSTRKRTPRKSRTEPQSDADVLLGAAIRTARKQRGMTLVQVGAASGLSHPFLSQLEHGRARPSMRSLFQIAEALGTTQQELLAAAQPPTDDLQRSSATPQVDATTGGARLLMQTKGGTGVTEFLGAPPAFEEFFRHTRHELLYVVSGSIDVEIVDADGTHRLVTLGPRDSIGYPGETEHRFRRHGAEPSIVLVIHTPDDPKPPIGS
ncbi:helix-turn-helix domain-containing protein [Ruania halotolerans]|uniref:helix-turn-helix domain-containing protein n=1 Tax=Ruania halotolerans TaxID=2897773 RepID=UPI001E3A936D|nr:XRE family transcriptional regulator [Ruania halotolerans]UFU07040.1 XRE family transcriptional regulator [Ruania halotolerans]